MKALVCERCGGAINPVTLKCEYCGTHYKDDEQPFILHVERPGIEVLSASFRIHNDQISAYDEEILTAYTKNEITHKLVEAISKHIEFIVQEDPIMNHHVVTGRIRIVPPGYKF